MKISRFIIIFFSVAVFAVYLNSCSYLTYTTVTKNSNTDSTSSEPDPDYDVSLNFDYQDFTSYLYMGNRIENFTAYFNTYFKAQQDYDEAFDEFRLSFIAIFNRSIDSLLVNPPASQNVKDKLNKSIERSSKIIQFHKNSKYIDDAVLLIGKSYYFLSDYINAERKFNEFLSKFSSSELTDEAILYLARSKNKLNKENEAENIYLSLLKNETEGEIKSLAARDYGVLEYKKGRPEEAAKYFRKAIEYTNDNVRKAESQFILAKLVSLFKPELAANEYKIVLDYTSDFDLSFYGRLNYAKGLTYNKKFSLADEELTSLRKKYRDEIGYAQLVDLELANNLYAQNKLKEAMDKYYEVIVKYPNSVASADAYFFIGRHEEEIENDYLNALVNYKKSVQENASSDYYILVSEKVSDLDRYFTLQSEVTDSQPIDIPQENFEVEKYRAFYNEEKGIEQFNETNKGGNNNEGNNKSGDENDGDQRGDGKGGPGGFNNYYFENLRDSTEDPIKEGKWDKEQSDDQKNSGSDNSPNKNENNENNFNPGNQDKTEKNDTESKNDTSVVNTDSLKQVQEEIDLKTKIEKEFNGYYELAELFTYKLDRSDSAEFYLKLILQKFKEPDQQSKVLYTLGNFYKSTGKDVKAQETFSKLIGDYSNTIYAIEAKKIIGEVITEDDVVTSTADIDFKKALELYNDQKYTEAVDLLKSIRSNAKLDSIKAKALYGIGFVFENGSLNKDSSLYYYGVLRSEYPESIYTQKISELLDYFAALEENNANDSLNTNSGNDSLKDASDTNNVAPTEINNEDEKKEEVVNPENENKENTDVNPEETGTDVGKDQLTPEEIQEMLKEAEKEGADPPPPPPDN
ncbi:MAG TPA: tetratricopeptide repeat protein [Ignavibacteria bacterium]|nr:tetratricopeptide repeat protein [Ignavibacteria bacterium]HRA99571.1 tetratricopeptide repeat protein [Ignavibacteria bacterium]